MPSHVFDVVADLADGLIYRFDDPGTFDYTADDAMMSAVRQAVATGKSTRELYRWAREREQTLNKRLAAIDQSVKTLAPNRHDIAALARRATGFDITEVWRLIEDQTVAFPESMPEPKLPYPVTLYVYDRDSRDRDAVRTWWWLAVQREGHSSITVPYAGCWMNGQRFGKTRMFGAYYGFGEDKVDDSDWRVTIMRFATLLTSCVNITPSLVSASPGWIRQRQKNKQFPVLSYRMLTLFPKGAQRRQHGSASGTGKRYHAVRGHFKHTKHGTFWWHPFWRGRKELGLVIKDYVVSGA